MLKHVEHLNLIPIIKVVNVRMAGWIQKKTTSAVSTSNAHAGSTQKPAKFVKSEMHIWSRFSLRNRWTFSEIFSGIHMDKIETAKMLQTKQAVSAGGVGQLKDKMQDKKGPAVVVVLAGKITTGQTLANLLVTLFGVRGILTGTVVEEKDKDSVFLDIQIRTIWALIGPHIC